MKLSQPVFAARLCLYSRPAACVTGRDRAYSLTKNPSRSGLTDHEGCRAGAAIQINAFYSTQWRPHRAALRLQPQHRVAAELQIAPAGFPLRTPQAGFARANRVSGHQKQMFGR